MDKRAAVDIVVDVAVVVVIEDAIVVAAAADDIDSEFAAAVV